MESRLGVGRRRKRYGAEEAKRQERLARLVCLVTSLPPGAKAALEGEPKGCVGEGGGSAIFRGDGERGSCPVCLCLHRMDSRGLRRAPWGRMGRAQRKAGGAAVY